MSRSRLDPRLRSMTRRIATNTAVERAALLDFLRPRHKGLLITTRADGRPQASPVACGVDAAGYIVVSTYPERAKARNARRDPRVSIVVLSDDFDGPWVQVDGSAEVIAATDDVEPLVEYFRCIAGEHPDWAEYREAMLKQGKALVRITPERWSPVATGGFPAASAEG
jgi:PPOX class probable F420-dependent enzyme